MAERDDYINGLRKLADWLEQHPAAQTPSVARINVPLMVNAPVEEHARATELEVHYDSDGNASATVQFGPIDYHAYGYADWDQHLADHQEGQARRWADEHGMTIRPTDAEGAGS